ncbi:hypothetical protein [Deminuibacter soli]|uniref:Sensor of ECF-type sigma factor n=1 Tax=Deminuibacter soli TaxID=2291815 RepID=A0A3E1NPQ1_9BACT|nr:hypothetical protein [Deminuibacter soli]RFM29915.1 hypothetical protein DXN05_02770 [Deminuibacter soli]
MKKIVFLITFLLLHGYFCMAQPGAGTTRAEVIKMGFITKELKLSPAEAQTFWPLYDSYIAELRNARLANPNDVLAAEEAALIIKKKYRPEFKKILGTDDRVNQTFMAEQQFRQMLRGELQKRQKRRFGN